MPCRRGRQVRPGLQVQGQRRQLREWDRGPRGRGRRLEGRCPARAATLCSGQPLSAAALPPCAAAARRRRLARRWPPSTATWPPSTPSSLSRCAAAAAARRVAACVASWSIIPARALVAGAVLPNSPAPPCLLAPALAAAGPLQRGRLGQLHRLHRQGPGPDCGRRPAVHQPRARAEGDRHQGLQCTAAQGARGAGRREWPRCCSRALMLLLCCCSALLHCALLHCVVPLLGPAVTADWH